MISDRRMEMAESGTEVFTIATPSTASPVIDEDSLAQIFFLLSRDADITRKGGKVWDWVSVTEVCRYWHAVATRSPRLWSYLDSYTFRSADRTQKFIQLSQNTDLTVIYNDEGAARDYFGDNLKASLKELRRIAHLKLSVNSGIGHPRKLLLFGLLASDYPAPCMQSIEIAICSHLTLPSVRLPSTSQGILRKVSLAYLNLSTVAPSLTHLQSLALNSCEISFSELHGILKACPMLENLKIKFCRIDCANTLTLEQVHAESLTNFKLLTRHPSELVEISEKLEAPNASRAIIWCDIYLEEVTVLEKVLKVMRRDFIAKRLTLRTDSNFHFTMTVHVYGNKTQEVSEEARLSLSFSSGIDMDTVLHCYTRLLHLYLTTTSVLEIDANDDSISTEAYSNFLRACKSAKTADLYIGLEEQTGEHCLAALAYTPELHHPAEEQVMALPKVEHLIVHYDSRRSYMSRTESDLFDELENVLKTRSTNGFPIHKVTIISENILDEGISEAIKQWVEEFEFLGLESGGIMTHHTSTFF